MLNHINIMSNEIEQWVDEALLTLNLTARKIEANSAQQIRSEVEARFVKGSPRAWWLGLPPTQENFPSNSTKLSTLVHNSSSMGWFIPEIESEKNSIVYRLSAEEVEDVIQECPFFEYYFLDKEYTCFIAETDHNQFIVVRNSGNP